MVSEFLVVNSLSLIDSGKLLHPEVGVQECVMHGYQVEGFAAFLRAFKFLTHLICGTAVMQI